MVAALQRQRIVECRDEVATRGIALINERDNGTSRVAGADCIPELQIPTDSQWDAIVFVVGTICCRCVRVAAMLHAVAKLICQPGRKRRLYRRGPYEVTEPKRIGPTDVGHRYAPLAGLPVVSVIPGPRHLVFRRYKGIESRRWKIGVVVILSAPSISVTVEIGAGNLGGSRGNLVVDRQDVLSNLIEWSLTRLGRAKSQYVSRQHLCGVIHGHLIGVDPPLRRRCQHGHRAGIQDWRIGALVIDKEECFFLERCKRNQWTSKVKSVILGSIQEPLQSLRIPGPCVGVEALALRLVEATAMIFVAATLRCELNVRAALRA